MFRIKICGVTTIDDALAAVEAGADAIGLNFCVGSPRRITEDVAASIVERLPSHVQRVGVFANESSTIVRLVVARLGLHLAQIHGDEPPAFLAELDGLPTLRAFRCGECAGETIRDYLALCLNATSRPRAILVDAASPSGFGGTGRVANWDEAARLAQDASMPPLVLAGGLRPENVAEAIASVCPAAIDTASGVEASPGRKDRARMQAFVKAARQAWEGLAGC